MTDLKNSGIFCFFVNILRIIRPLREVYPVWVAKTWVYYFKDRTTEPSYNHLLVSLASLISIHGNLPMGILSPVRLDSFT